MEFDKAASKVERSPYENPTQKRKSFLPRADSARVRYGTASLRVSASGTPTRYVVRLGASAAIATIGCCAVVASNASVAAESYPTRPIRIVDGFALFMAVNTSLAPSVSLRSLTSDVLKVITDPEVRAKEGWVPASGDR